MHIKEAAMKVDSIHTRGLSCAFLVLSLLVASCSARPPFPGQGPTKPNPRLPTAVISSGPVKLTAELATTADQRERGLMFRNSLKDGEGMLFVFDSDQVLAFWMKNTNIPLSIAYIGSDGVIREIHDMEPHSLAGITSSRSVRYALEVPKGWFGRVGLHEGDRLELPKLD
jgi:uncharacterized membrane protein (UPF0127 family)